MMISLFAMAAAMSGDATATQPTPAAPAAVANMRNGKLDPFTDRPEARIPFRSQVRNFQVKRDGYDDVLYLETTRDRWFRSEISCIGPSDPRDAQGLIPIGNDSGFDRMSRVALVGFGHRSTECLLDRLVELTPNEAVELKLVRRRGPAVPATPTAPKAD